MQGVFSNEVGNTYNSLTVISRAPNNRAIAMWNCRCVCGNRSVVAGANLRNNHVKSCGCKKNVRMGLSLDPIYVVWSQMIGRIDNPKHVSFRNYGGRGISVCTEWRSFELFYEWATGRWEAGLELDREDNDGDYTPENCRFVTSSLNCINRRKYSFNTSGYTGVHLSKREGKYKVNVTDKTTIGRVHLGTYLTKEEAVTARNNFIIENGLPHKVQENNHVP